MDDSELVKSTPITSGRIQPVVPDDQSLGVSDAPETGADQTDRPELGEREDREVVPEVGPEHRPTPPSAGR